VLEAAGTAVGGPELEDVQLHCGGQTGSGNCDCGIGGGCGNKSGQGETRDALGASSHAACASCGISKLLAARNRQGT
jgi:hypothetical protein